jgi:hypothetical protein
VSSGSSPHDVASWKVRYAPSRINPKWVRLMIRRTPQLTDSPAAMRAYRPPTSTPVRAA